MKREKWLDCIKIIACFLVVMLHTTNFGIKENAKNIVLIVYYIGVLAIPLFFMVNGYLQLRKKDITYWYCIKKILKILVIVLICNFIRAIICFILKGEHKNIFIESIANIFLQYGYFNHFWFFGALIIIYCFLPLINQLFNISKILNIIITIYLVIICILIDLVNIRNNLLGNGIIKFMVPQPFRLWTWFTYFCIGGCLSKLEIKKINTIKLSILTAVITICTIFFEYFLSYKLYGCLFPENFYDNILIICNSILVFILIKQFDLKKSRIIERIAPLTMGIYIIHTTIIELIKYFIYIPNNFSNLIFPPIIFGISAGISYIIYKVPKLNKLIKL